MQRLCWQLVEPGQPLRRTLDTLPEPGPDEVVVRVAGCGVCHTDLGFYHGHVRTRAPLPLVLGHEIVGRVVAAGARAGEWLQQDVLVAAVIPCGECGVCRSGRGNICPRQVMPGNDADGGFATHVRVRASGLTPIASLPRGVQLADLAVVADAVTTPLQAVRRARVSGDELVIVIGVGGVGGFAVQIAAATGASVVGVDVNTARLERIAEHGAAAVVDASGMQPRQLRDAVRAEAARLGHERFGWKIFECSGTTAGQQSAWSLLCPAATLAVVGFTPEAASFRLSNLMAFDATAFGSWGCPPERYPEAVDLVCSGAVQVRPFVHRMPLSQIQEAFALAEAGSLPERIVLVPETPGDAA